MTTLASSIGTSQAYIPVVNASQLGKLVGVPKYFPTLAALNAAVSAENANIAAGSPLWGDGEPLAVLKGATYQWSVSTGTAVPVSGTGPLPVSSATSASATETLNFGAGLETALQRTLTTNVAYTIGSLPAANIEQRMVVDLVQDATGNRVPTFANVTWAGGAVPTWSVAPNRIDTVQFRAVGSYILGFPLAMNQAPPSVPSAPVITATAGNGQVVINGTASANPSVTGYTIKRGTSAGGESATPIATNVALPYTDTGRTNGTAYYYTMAAVNSLGTGAYSSEATATPVAPTAGHYVAISNTNSGLLLANAPSYSALMPAGNPFSVRVLVQPTNAGTFEVISALWNGAGNTNTSANSMYYFYINNSGQLSLAYKLATGAEVDIGCVNALPSSVATTPTWLRFDITPSTGAVAFYSTTNADESGYTSLGSIAGTPTAGNIATPTANVPLTIMASGTGDTGTVGKVFAQRILVNGAEVSGLDIRTATSSTLADTQGRSFSGFGSGVQYI